VEGVDYTHSDSVTMTK